MRATSWSGSESERNPQGVCSSNEYVPNRQPRFLIKAGTIVKVKSVSKGGDWLPYRTKRDLGYAMYESRRGWFLTFREEGYWILVRRSCVQESK